MTAHPSSMIMTRIGGQDYPMRSVSSCRTCQSESRLYIENELIQGRSYRAISRAVADMPNSYLGPPSHESIRDHYANGHLPLGVSSQRRLMERRSAQLGKAIQDADDLLMDHVTVAEMVVARGFERLQAGEIQPEVSDILAASKFLHQVEQESGGDLDRQAFENIMVAYMETVTKFIPPERMSEFNLAMAKHPVIVALNNTRQDTIEGSLAEDISTPA